MIVERRVAARSRLQAIVKIEDDLVQRKLVREHHSTGADVFELLLRPPLLFEQFQDLPQILLARDYRGVDDRLFDLLDPGRVREFGGIVHFQQRSVGLDDPVADTGRRRDQVDFEFPLQALLDDFQVQQAQEAATEAEAQGDRIFGLEVEGAVVQTQLFERFAQAPVFVTLHRIQSGEHHRLCGVESRQGFACGIFVVRDGVADLGIGDSLDGREQEADFAGRKLIARDRFGRLIT